MSEKDYDRYAYFISKAKNFAICIKPDRKKVVDGEINFEPGLRVEFNNGMKRVEKTKENQIIIETLRKKIEEEKDLSPKKKTLWEETKPEVKLSEKEVQELMAEKEREIEELKESLGKSKANLKQK